MATIVNGIVQDGKIVPEVPLPDGLAVQIVLSDPTSTEEAELLAEMAAWRAGNARALERVDVLVDGE